MAYRNPPPDQGAVFYSDSPRPSFMPPKQHQHDGYSTPESTRQHESSFASGGNQPQEFPRAPPPPPPQQQPIDEAVNTAFDRAETSNVVPPELIAQITANVIQQLKTTAFERSIPIPAPAPYEHPPQLAPPPPPVVPSYPPPPTAESAGSAGSPSAQSIPSPQADARGVYTPPSPHRLSEDRGSPKSPTAFPPMNHQNSPRKSSSPHSTAGRSMDDRRTVSPLSQNSDASHLGERNRAGSRATAGGEETTLERIWGQLFDDGKPTVRLGQFLRGVAVHLV